MTIIVSVSMPEELRSALDAAAERRQRSRSFVVAEAVREYLAHSERAAFDDARVQTLREGLVLTPPERVQLSEELWRELAFGRGASEPWARSFTTFDERERFLQGIERRNE